MSAPIEIDMRAGTGVSATPANLLENYSIEVTARDRKSQDAVSDLPAGTEVFVAALPKDRADDLVAACVRLRASRLTPVPHIVARNIDGDRGLDDLLGRLAQGAGLDRCLVLGGDRDQPAGSYHSSLQLLESGLFQKHGVRRLRIGCYPEGHPKIDAAVLDHALDVKIALAGSEGFDVTLVSQFCFDAAPIAAFAGRLRARGVRAPLRVGVAGPANARVLLKYALICGIGNSVRVLKNRGDLARNTLMGETPDEVVGGLAAAHARAPALGLSGVHFFTFGAVADSIRWAEAWRTSHAVGPGVVEGAV